MNVPHGWQRYTDPLPDWFIDYLALEQGAAQISSYESLFVPGLLQTADYARAVIGLAYTDPDELDRRVELRMARQQLLDGDGAPRVRALIDEAALTRPPLAPPQARAQLDRLIALTERPQVTVRIVPTTENSRSPHPSFTILEFAEADRPDVVYLEEPDGARYLDQPAEVARYRDVLNSLDSPAAAPEDTRSALHRIREQV